MTRELQLNTYKPSLIINSTLLCSSELASKKANSYSIKRTHQPGLGIGQVQQAVCAMQTAQRINTKTLGECLTFNKGYYENNNEFNFCKPDILAS
jgi:hypothetical protein